MRHPVTGLPCSGGRGTRRRLVGVLTLVSAALGSLLVLSSPATASDTGFKLPTANDAGFGAGGGMGNTASVNTSKAHLDDAVPPPEPTTPSWRARV
jgi:hypothetical protein